jgi:Cys-tRNA synthase (O-phospho-L-seryl-tRNA:Cys-tRNA synthase)
MKSIKFTEAELAMLEIALMRREEDFQNYTDKEIEVLGIAEYITPIYSVMAKLREVRSN